MGQWHPPWMGQWLGLGLPPLQMREQRREEENKFQWQGTTEQGIQTSTKTKTGAGLDKCTRMDYDEPTGEKKTPSENFFNKQEIRHVDEDIGWHTWRWCIFQMKAANLPPVAQMTNICLLTGLYFFWRLFALQLQLGSDVRTEAGSLGGISKDVGQRRR